MPWNAGDASKKTKKASTPNLKKQWRDIANNVLSKTGDDAKAIKVANGVIKRRKAKGK